jgi:Domain of unknown function (DUF5666)
MDFSTELYSDFTSPSKHEHRAGADGEALVMSARVSRCASVAVAGLAALSLAGCGSSNPPSTSASSTKLAAPSASPAPGAAGNLGKDKAFGLIGSVTGGTVTLAGSNGPVTVDVGPSTRVVEVTPGQLTDVITGECAVVLPTKDSTRPPTVTAAAMVVGPAANGQCGGRGIAGTIASVSDNLIVLTAANNSQTAVTVTPDTRFAKRSRPDTSAIAVGKCLAARGTKDGSGTLQATAVYLQPSNNGQCGHRRQGG